MYGSHANKGLGTAFVMSIDALAILRWRETDRRRGLGVGARYRRLAAWLKANVYLAAHN